MGEYNFGYLVLEYYCYVLLSIFQETYEDIIYILSDLFLTLVDSACINWHETLFDSYLVLTDFTKYFY